MSRRLPKVTVVCVAIVVGVAALIAGHGALAATTPSCEPDTLKYLTVKGTIHFVKSTVRPIIGQDGKADYSIVDTIDEYEVSGPHLVCGWKTLRVRFEYGDVKYVDCADGAEATVSGFLRRDVTDGSIFLSVVSPSDLVCKAAK
jgi:hypothetical protein